jgi:hypothetical protein
MTTLAAVLFTAVVMGYGWHRTFLKLAAAESELEACHDLIRWFFRRPASSERRAS